MNLAGLLRHAAMCFPERPAVTWRDTTIDYAELERRAATMDGWLRSVGAGRDMCFVLFMDNRLEYLVAMFATWRSGATVVPCNARPTTDELAFLVGDAGATVVLTDDAHEQTARAAAGASGNAATVGVAASTASKVRLRPTRPTWTPATSPGSSTRRAPPDIRRERCCHRRSCIS